MHFEPNEHYEKLGGYVILIKESRQEIPIWTSVKKTISSI
jgi:hypothetical protein